ncbi:hypothetical protein OKW50_002140 [Paraburkholderia youngii]
MTRPDERRPSADGRYSRRSKLPCRRDCRRALVVLARAVRPTWCAVPVRSVLAGRALARVWRRVGARRTPVAAGPAMLAGAACTSRWTSTRLEKRGILPEERQAASAGRQRAARRRAARCACATPARFCGRRAAGRRASGRRAAGRPPFRVVSSPAAPCVRLHAAMERCGAVAHDCLVGTQPLHSSHRSD